MEGIYNSNVVHEHFPEAIMVAAMKVWSLPEHKKDKLQECCESGEYLGQIKKDGFWYEFNRTENHSYLFSRNESAENGLLTEKIKNVPHIEKALSVLPKDTIVIGEIHVPGKQSKDTTRIMGCLPATSIKRQNEEGLIHYYLHDIIAFNGISMIKMPCEKRINILNKVFHTYNLGEHDFMELAETHTDDLFAKIGQALDNGEEGMVLKKKDAPYFPGKKPAWSAIKCKKVDYLDVVCMGFEDATEDYTGTELDNWQFWQDQEGNKYNSYEKAKEQPLSIKPITKPYYFGWKTSIVIGAYNDKGELQEIGTVSSGLSDDDKINISKSPETYIGKTIKIQCMERDNKSQTLRHPIYKGFREDKNARECTLVELF